MCGGTPGETRPRAVFVGLSPRVRGNRSLDIFDLLEPGSIPACAGEPYPASGAGSFSKVYPRVCGGTSSSFRASFRAWGLSPRVRGNPRHHPPQWSAPGSIPACAGEPATHQSAGASTGVYPRVCGGTNLKESWEAAMGGLSPRVRGNPLPVGCGLRILRSIPACAGEPLTGSLTRRMWEVYPRVCGGTRNAGIQERDLRGLSPRVRGNLSAGVATNEVLRSIPACAGEPW